MKIGTNINSIHTQTQLARTTTAIAKAITRLSSGKRVNSPEDDPAAYSLGVNLQTQIRGLSQATLNINQAKGLLDTVGAALQSQVTIVSQMRVLALRASSSSLTLSDRQDLQSTLESLLDEFSRITDSTQFNGIHLLDENSQTLQFQIGSESGSSMNFALPNLSASSAFLKTVGLGSFETEKTFQTTNGAKTIWADFNNDGQVDVANMLSSGSVRVQLGYGSGVFGVGKTFAIGTTFTTMGTQDLNDDGILDLVLGDATGASGGDIQYYIGNGDGTFRFSSSFSPGSMATGIDFNDFDLDGLADIFVTDSSSVSAGNGTFQNRTTRSAGDQPNEVQSAYINGDSNIDLIVANEAGQSISIFLGNGNGTFQNPTTLTLGGDNQRSVSVGDVNGDNKQDIIVVERSNKNVGVYLGNGDGTFQAEMTTALVNIGNPVSVKLADVDNDTKLDIVIATNLGAGHGGLAILRGNGNGTFKAPQYKDDGGNYQNMAIGNFNGDSFLDIAATGEAGTNISFYLGNGDGTFQNKTLIATAASVNIPRIEAGDYNKDGKLDLVAAAGDGANITLLAGNGDGTFAAFTTLTSNTFGTSIALADLNGDTNLDVINSDKTGSEISVFLGNGDGTFAARTTKAASGDPTDIHVTDINNDGASDLVVADWAADQLSFYIQNTSGGSGGNSFVLLSNGDGTFQSGITVGSPGDMVKTADLNRDGIADAIIGSSTNAAIYIRFGNGNGTFAAAVTTSITNLSAQGIELGDLNNDGILDLVTTLSTGVVQVRRGNGNGTFAAASQINTAVNATSRPTLKDMNGDGFLDIVARIDASTVGVYLNKGGLAFSERSVSSTTGTDIALDDLNGDGVPDILRSTGYSIAQTKDTGAVSDFNLLSEESAQKLLDILDDSIDKIQSDQMSVAAAHSRLDASADYNLLLSDSLSEAESRAVDVDFAEEVAELVKNQILQQAQVAVLAQANVSLALALQLLQKN